MASVFSQIIRRELPGKIIYEDDVVFCILPNGHFVNPGHLLVIPRQEVDYIFDLEADVYHRLWEVARHLAIPLKEVTLAERVGIAVEGFSVPHVHIHLCPLFSASELNPYRQEEWSEEEQENFISELVPKLNF